MSFQAALLDGLVGIVTGILTAALLFGLKVVVQQYFLPLYRQYRYEGVVLEGQWAGYDEDIQTQSQLTLLLEQKAHDLAGTFRMEHVSPEHSFDLMFKVSGYIWEGYITLNLKPADPKVTSYATGLLKVTAGGNVLIGQLAYRHAHEDRVFTMPLLLGRGTPAYARQQYNAVRDRGPNLPTVAEPVAAQGGVAEPVGA